MVCVPQGSILGPSTLLFLIHINDLTHSSKNDILLLLFVTSLQAQISAFNCTSMLNEGPSPRGFSATKQPTKKKFFFFFFFFFF